MEPKELIACFTEAQVVEALTATFPETVRAVQRRDNLLCALPHDLLVYVLSFAWAHASALARTCSQFAAVVRERAFWEPAVTRWMRDMIAVKRKTMTEQDVEFYTRQWTPFDDFLLPTLRQKVGWLFRKQSGVKMVWMKYDDNTIGLRIKDASVFIAQWQLRQEDGEYQGIFQSLTEKYMRFRYYWKPGQIYGAICHEEYASEAPVIRLYEIIRKYNGGLVRWQGRGLCDPCDQTMSAHGAGKWTDVATGAVILEGTHVAFHNCIHDGVTWFAHRRLDEEPPSKRVKTTKI